MAREETALDAMWRSGHDGNYASASDFGVRAPSHAVVWKCFARNNAGGC